MHQSAKDGYRSYLQAYASYSLKKIFDVNQLDLAKVGKAFGFAVPPRVNVALGGKASTASAGGKRRRDDASEDSDDVDGVDGPDEPRHKNARREKDRRIETVGRKQVDKEVYKKGGYQKGWSR